MLPRKWARSVIVLVVAGVLLIWAGAFASQGALVLAGIYCVNILHSIYTARRQAAAEQKEQTV